MSIMTTTSGQPNYQGDNNQKYLLNSLDSTLIKAAKGIYQTYCTLHGKLAKKPIGVAIDPKTHRGQLVFSGTPVLLPGEQFVPIKQIENEVS